MVLLDNTLSVTSLWIDDNSCEVVLKNLSVGHLELEINPLPVPIGKTKEEFRVKTGERLVEYCDVDTGECFTRLEPVWEYKSREEVVYSHVEVDVEEVKIDSNHSVILKSLIKNRDEASRAFNMILDITYIIDEKESGQWRVRIPVDL